MLYFQSPTATVPSPPNTPTTVRGNVMPRKSEKREGAYKARRGASGEERLFLAILSLLTLLKASDWTDRQRVPKTFLNKQLGAPKTFLAVCPEPCPQWLQQRVPRAATGHSSTQKVFAQFPKHPRFTGLCCCHQKLLFPSTARLPSRCLSMDTERPNPNVLPTQVPHTHWRTSDN